jgi:predicted Zn finger-like uncharacterized protein
MFKVVPDQLRVSDGWVRCGQCNEVFDANANLQHGVDEAPKAHVPQVVAEVAAVSLVHAAETESAAAEITSTDTPPPEPFLEVNPHALHLELHDKGATAAEADVPSDTPVRSSLQDVLAEDLSLPPTPAEELPKHSFMHTGPSPSRWDQTWVRVTLSFAGLVLGGGLFLQVVVQERDRIAAVEPASRRFIEPLCEMLNCKIAPLRQIESIVIDSSSFIKVRSDVYHLSVTLKNTAQIPIATPDLELTLTDMQDQSVVRRVFSAGVFAQHQLAMDPASEMQITLPVTVKLNAGTEKVSGYRLLSFYP